MTIAQTILKVRKHIPFLLLTAIAGFGISYLIMTHIPADYRSETTFYINENVVINSGMGHIEAQEMNILSTMATNKVLVLVGSDELRDSIIKDFDLYKHYEIDPNGQFAHEMVLVRLNKKINIRREPTSVGVIHLSVEDKDRFVAANVANKIVARINLMNKDILKNDLQRRAGQYESVLPDIRDKVSNTRKEFLTFVDSVTPIAPKQYYDNGELPGKYRIIASDLAGKMDKSSNKYEDLLEQYHAIMGSIKTVGNDEWQCVTIVKKALPDVTSWQRLVLLYSLGISLLLTISYLSAVVYYYQNETEVSQMWRAVKGKGPAAHEG